jgi:hypothetical protein
MTTFRDPVMSLRFESRIRRPINWRHWMTDYTMICLTYLWRMMKIMVRTRRTMFSKKIAMDRFPSGDTVRTSKGLFGLMSPKMRVFMKAMVLSVV